VHNANQLVVAMLITAGYMASQLSTNI